MITRISGLTYSRVVGWSLVVFGSGFFVLVLVEVGQHGWDAKAWTTYFAMLTSSLFVLAGLSYLMPATTSSVLTRFIVIRAIIMGGSPPDVPRLKENLNLVFSRAQIDAEARRHTDVPFLDADPPLPDEWNSLVRPVLHQASQYMAPTYYLNSHLQVIDWNLCFDLIFEGIIGELRGRHVNWFIARLQNREAVFQHASAFPDRIEDQPQVDTERLVYSSEKYGMVDFEKIATKLHDLHGQERGWAVTLMIREAQSWEALMADLSARIEDDKFWSIYSVSYDRVLNAYTGYEQLLKNVVGGVPKAAMRVADLGAGTGNSSRRILESAQGRRVWSVEKNMAMLDLFRSKDWVRRAGDDLKIVKSSVEHLEMLAFEDPFDAAVAVNVLYAIDDVPACLASLNRILRMGATFSFSTTDNATKLTPLLDDIATKLRDVDNSKEMLSHYERVRSLNLKLEQKGLTTRYTREQYLAWLGEAGFRVDSYERGYYAGAVAVGKATKVDELAPPVDDSITRRDDVRDNGSVLDREGRADDARHSAELPAQR